MNNKLAKTTQLTWFYLKKDWLVLTLWFVIVGGLNLVIAAIYNQIYGTPAQVQSIVTTLKTPAMVALFGSLPPLKTYTTFDIAVGEMLLFTIMMMVVMNFQLVIKNTRAEEEKGVNELLRSLAVGKFAQPMAVLIEVMSINVAIALTGLSYRVLNGATWPATLLFVAGLLSSGLLFMSIVLLTAQLARQARLATAMGYLIFGVMFVGRMVTDTVKQQLTWLSPLGWVEKSQIGATNNWLPVILLVCLSLVIIGGSLWLLATRDLGTGLVSISAGPATAPKSLRGWLSLQVRLERTSFVIWLLGLSTLGMSYGAIFHQIKQLAADNAVLKNLLGTSKMTQLGDQIVLVFMHTILIMPVTVVSIAGLIAMGRFKRDLENGTIDLISAHAISRLRLYVGYVGSGVLFTLGAWLAAIYSMFVAQAIVMPTPITITKFNAVAVNAFPILLFFVGLAAILLGWLPKWYRLVYLVLGLNFYMLYLGKMLKMPEWLIQVMPNSWVAQAPLSAIDWGSWVVVLTLALALIGLGYLGYRQGDLRD